MISPFAQYKQQNLKDIIDIDNEMEKMKRVKMVKHIHFVVYTLPLQLDKHSSYPKSNHCSKSNARSKSSSKIMLSSAGILMTSHRRRVTFSSTSSLYTCNAFESYHKNIKLD
jgi:hypothetical protein